MCGSLTVELEPTLDQARPSILADRGRDDRDDGGEWQNIGAAAARVVRNAKAAKWRRYVDDARGHARHSHQQGHPHPGGGSRD